MRNVVLIVAVFGFLSSPSFGIFTFSKRNPINRSVACAFLMNEVGSGNDGWTPLSGEDAVGELEFFTEHFEELSTQDASARRKARRLRRLGQGVANGTRELVAFRASDVAWHYSDDVIPAVNALTSENLSAGKRVVLGINGSWLLGFLATGGSIMLLNSNLPFATKIWGTIVTLTATTLVMKDQGLKYLAFKLESLPDLRSDLSPLFDLAANAKAGMVHTGGRGHIHRRDRGEFFSSASRDLRLPRVRRAPGLFSRWYGTSVDYDWFIEAEPFEGGSLHSHTVFFSRRGK